MLHHPPIPAALASLWAQSLFRLPLRSPSAAVLGEFLRLPFLGAVIGHAAARRALLAVRLSAAKGTAQVPALPLVAAGIAGVGEEEDAAMLAAGQATSQVGMRSQRRPQDDIVFQDQAANLATAVPVRLKLKMALDPYGKKPRLSLMMLMRPACLMALALVSCIGA